MRTLTAELGAVLVRVLCSLLVGCSSNIKQAIHAGLHSIRALIAKLERLLRVSSILIDHFVNEVLDR